MKNIMSKSVIIFVIACFLSFIFGGILGQIDFFHGGYPILVVKIFLCQLCVTILIISIILSMRKDKEKRLSVKDQQEEK